MDNQDILQRIQALVQEEHELRDQPQDSAGSEQQDQATRLKRVEEELDQCWDLLRQRRAKADAGENPAEADARPISQVEGYRQ
jgi:phage shock protein A